MGRLCYPTTAPGRVLVPRVLGATKLSRCKEGMAHFLPSGYKLYLALRVSRYKVDREQVISQDIQSFIAGTSAVSRYKLSRNQKIVMIQDFDCGQMRVSGCNGYYKFVLSAGAKAKSVTNNLPILSVLCAALIFQSIV